MRVGIEGRLAGDSTMSHSAEKIGEQNRSGKVK
jgi:hypothetical protein